MESGEMRIGVVYACRMSNPEAVLLPIEAVLALHSNEGAEYCLDCFRRSEGCLCEDGFKAMHDDHHVVDILLAKRTDDQYPSLLRKIRNAGQQEAVEICANRCCLLEGHHRVAALDELETPDVLAIFGGDCSVSLD